MLISFLKDSIIYPPEKNYQSQIAMGKIITRNIIPRGYFPLKVAFFLCEMINLQRIIMKFSKISATVLLLTGVSFFV